MQQGKPYYAVIFTSLRTTEEEGYNSMAQKMVDLAKDQPGFMGVESAREEVGITVSYWETMEDIQKWRQHSEHETAREQGKKIWYSEFKVRICQVLREYDFSGEKKDAH
ncbi:MAG: antibiotic biosynthesis monooxygenase [Flavobacteriaceae bacterium]|nr:MAG: antibiotic biosynthesis monooxygenase [Flavobacteriaceae bacterium]